MLATAGGSPRRHPEALADLAPRLDLMFSREGGSISDNLRTVVSTAGRVFRQFTVTSGRRSNSPRRWSQAANWRRQG